MRQGAYILYDNKFTHARTSLSLRGSMQKAAYGSMMPAIMIIFIYLFIYLFNIYYLVPATAACVLRLAAA
jgi:hypothetical protein